ncbi:MAG: iron-sulfur cluster assembly protein [Rickettsiales bacterium]|jgi:metal-sulfur cluster biosynthetic enzyme|nr:iron-sulfur cluster assembly protein [Rickettsiales bacterium]
MRTKIIEAIKTVYDPEIPVNVWDLGLVYDIVIKEDNGQKDKRTKGQCPSAHLSICPLYSLSIRMTMTSPTCPMSEEILEMVRTAVAGVHGVLDVSVELVWDPPWDLSRMSAAAKLELDLTEQGW